MSVFPLVSVIVPNYNHAQFLEQRLESILSQTFRDFEILILDDCSTDNSREVIEMYRGNEKVVSIIYNEKNSGSAFFQWQKGIQNSKGKYLWIAESDDFCDGDFLEKGVAKLNDGFDLFNVLTIDIDERGVQLNKKKLWQDDLSPTRWKSDFENRAIEEVKEMLFLKNTIANASAVLFKRTEKIKDYLNEIVGMRYCGDWIFWMMYLLDADRLYYSTATKNYFRSHSNTTRRKFSQQDRNDEVLKVLQFVLKSPVSKGKRRLIVRYYFDNHFYHRGKRDLVWNLKQFTQQFFVSPYFLSCWLGFYRK